jgi:hypothetical protein
VTGYVQKHIRRLLGIDAVKKADAPHRPIIPLCFVFFVHKSRNTANQPVFGILQYPTGDLPMPEGLIFGRVENFVNIGIYWTDIGGILTV